MHHGVRIQDAALVAAATLSHRYITDRFLPDKAIDLVDEAASRVRMQIDSMPEELDQLERKLMQLEIEREALKKESDAASARAARARRAGDRRAAASGATRMKARWQNEKSAIATHARAEGAARGAERRARSARSARATSSAPPRSATASWSQLEKELAASSSSSSTTLQQGRLAALARRSPPRRSPRSSRSGPASPSPRCWRASRRSCSHMEDKLRQRVVGQDEALQAVVGRGAPRARRACRTRTGRSARSSSSAPPASARPRPRARSPSSCSTTSTRWSAST